MIQVVLTHVAIILLAIIAVFKRMWCHRVDYIKKCLKKSCKKKKKGDLSSEKSVVLKLY